MYCNIYGANFLRKVMHIMHVFELNCSFMSKKKERKLTSLKRRVLFYLTIFGLRDSFEDEAEKNQVHSLPLLDNLYRDLPRLKEGWFEFSQSSLDSGCIE